MCVIVTRLIVRMGVRVGMWVCMVVAMVVSRSVLMLMIMFVTVFMGVFVVIVPASNLTFRQGVRAVEQLPTSGFKAGRRPSRAPARSGLFPSWARRGADHSPHMGCLPHSGKNGPWCNYIVETTLTREEASHVALRGAALQGPLIFLSADQNHPTLRAQQSAARRDGRAPPSLVVAHSRCARLVCCRAL